MTKIKRVFLLILLFAFASNIMFAQTAFADDEISFECENLAAALSEILGKDTVTVSDIQGLDGKLDLSYQNIKSLEGLQYATNITSLVLSFNNLTDITPILQLSNLESLYLDYNWLNALPDEATGLTSLEHLDISNNEIEEIPAAFLELPALRRLYMGDLQLTAAPELSGLSDTLDRLDITGAVVDDYSFIEGLTNLELLIMNGCEMTKLPDLSGMQGLNYLYFSDNRIVTLPDYLGSLPLIRLDFSSNYISQMPQSFAQLYDIEQLIFTDNYFTELPQAVTAMVNLEVLMCGQNLISDVPDNMSALKNIKRASFASNNLTTLEKFSGFEIPYSYQVSFSLNYLDLADATNAEVLEDYHNDGGTQKQAAVSAEVVSADTESLSVSCVFDEAEFEVLGSTAAYYSLKLFSVQAGQLIPVGETDLTGEDLALVVEHVNPPEGTADYIMCLVIKDATWPEKYIKYSVELSGVNIALAQTPEPTATELAATPTPAPSTTEETAPEKGIDTKYLLYILLLGVIIIITAIIIQVVFYRRK